MRDELTTLGLNTDIERDNSGAVVVNQSLAATSAIWVAGDNASIFTKHLGRGIFTGTSHAVNTAKVAAANMMDEGLLYASIPVLECRVPEAGINMTFIGNCSSALNNYGYWWKPLVTTKRKKQVSLERGKDLNKRTSVEVNSTKYFPDIFKSPPKKLSKDKVHMGNANVVKISSSEVSKLSSRPNSSTSVYGDGLVFYMSGDVIYGVMINGLTPLIKSEMIQPCHEHIRSLIGKTLTLDPKNAAFGEQYMRYVAILDLATEVVDTYTDQDLRNETLRAGEAPLFNYSVASKATIRALNMGTQSLGPSIASDLSFSTGGGTISSAEITSAAYRRGLTSRTNSF
jgi:hypothetical protein